MKGFGYRDEHRPSFVVALLLTLSMAACTLALSGCAGVSASTYCYTATAATVRAVDVGMGVAGDLYTAGKLSEPTKVKLIAAHDVYRPAAKAAVDGCKAVSDNDQATADKLIADIQNASVHVIEALVAAGVVK